MPKIINDFPSCYFCGNDVDIDNNPKWNEEKAIKSIKKKWNPIKIDEYFWCCDQCEILLKRIMKC